MDLKQTHLTQEGYDSLVNELNKLKNIDRIKNLEDLKEARAQGDLSENADYDAAREQQREIERRIKEIENTLKNATVMDESASSTNMTNLGRTIRFQYNDTLEVEEYKLVSSIEANPIDGKISNECPVGSVLMRAKMGEVVNVQSESGEYKITILSIK